MTQVNDDRSRRFSRRWLALGLVGFVSLVAVGVGAKWATATWRACSTARAEVAAERSFNAARPPGPTVAFLGDSYTVGRGADSMATGFAAQTAGLLGMTAFLAGSSGSGFTATGACHDAPFSTRVDDVVRARPSAILVQGGLNDRGVTAARETSAASAVLSRIRSAAPAVRVVVLGPVDPTGNDPRVAQVRDSLRAQATSQAIPFIDPLAQGWLADRGAYISADGLHPNQAGHDELARRLAGALRG